MTSYGTLADNIEELFWRLFDTRREPCIVLESSLSPEQIVHALSGKKRNELPSRFSAKGRDNGYITYSHFTIAPETDAYVRRIFGSDVDRPFTHHYPASKSFNGRIEHIRNGSLISIWYRLSNIRIIGYSIFISLVLSIVGAVVMGKEALRSMPTLILFIVILAILLPFTVYIFTTIRVSKNDQVINEYKKYINGLIDVQGSPTMNQPGT
jgi:hypothetical protein